MQKLRTFFHSVVNSLKFAIDPGYARDILKAPMGFSWSLVIFFTLLTTVVTAVRYTIPVAVFDLQTVAQDVASVYPSDLVISGDRDGITINQELPYEVTIPENLQTKYGLSEVAEELPETLVLFTTDADLEARGGLLESDAWAIVTEDYAYVREDSSGQFSTYDVSTIESPFQVTRENVDMLVGEVMNQPFIANKWYVPVIFLALLILGAIGSIIARSAMAVVASLAALLFAGIFMKQSELKFGQFFQLALHAIVPVAFVILILDIFMLRANVPSWLYTLGVIVIILRGAQVLSTVVGKTKKK